MANKAPDYLTETHKLKAVYGKHKLFIVVSLFVSAVLFSYLMFDASLAPFYLTEQQEKRLIKLRELYDKFHHEKYKQEIQKFESQIPNIVTIYHVVTKLMQNDTVSRKLIFVGWYFGWYAIFIGGLFFIKHRLKKDIESVVYQKPFQEDIMPLKNDIILPLSHTINPKFINVFFKEHQKVEKIINTAIIFHDLFAKKQPEIKAFIKEHQKGFLNYSKVFYPFLCAKENKWKTKSMFTFLMWHFILNYYGNVPTGVLSIYQVDNDFKIALSSYQRMVLPTFYNKHKISPYSREYEVQYNKDKLFVYFFLRALYEYATIVCIPEQKKTTTTLFEIMEDKFSPLPFKF